MELPSKYPLDETLLARSDLAVGLDPHEKGGKVGLYKMAAIQFNRKHSQDKWEKAIKAENDLRRFIATAPVQGRII